MSYCAKETTTKPDEVPRGDSLFLQSPSPLEAKVTQCYLTWTKTTANMSCLPSASTCVSFRLCGAFLQEPF